MEADKVMAVIASLTFVYGVFAWKREFVGKRRIELAEQILTTFYEADDAVASIRSPLSSTEESASRKRSENESREDAQALDLAYVVFARYKLYESTFASLRSLKYRAKATFGKEIGIAFDDYFKLINEVLVAARLLGHLYWRENRLPQRDEQRAAENYESQRRFEEKIWGVGDEGDLMAKRFSDCISQIEALMQPIIASLTPR